MKDKRFKGTTPTFLMRQYCNLVDSVKRTTPGIVDEDVTSEMLLEYLDKRSRNLNKVKSHSKIIQGYLTIKISL